MKEMFDDGWWMLLVYDVGMYWSVEYENEDKEWENEKDNVFDLERNVGKEDWMVVGRSDGMDVWEGNEYSCWDLLY